jgi:predicted cobalt transporter CbtA
MARSLLIRGMLVGLVAGLLAFLFSKLLGEPQVVRAIAFEAAQAKAAGEAEQPELVSRTVQSTIGLLTAVALYGVAFGGVFGLAFGFVYGRIGRFGPRATAALLALAGFVAIELVPFLKYPPNPPAVGDPETIGRRTTLYVLLIVISVLSMVVAIYLRNRLAPRFGGWDSTLIAIGAFVAFMVVVFVLLPRINEIPAGFPATVLWWFRVTSFGTQLVVWSTFGLLFGALTERSLRRPARPAGTPESAQTPT